MELNELRKTAEAATPGPWEARQHNELPGKYVAGPRYRPNDIGRGLIALMQPVFWHEESAANAEFIATFNPETVLALLSRLEHAEQAVTRVRAMAQDWEANGNSCAVGDRSADVWHATANAILRALDGDGRG